MRPLEQPALLCQLHTQDIIVYAKHGVSVPGLASRGAVVYKLHTDMGRILAPRTEAGLNEKLYQGLANRVRDQRAAVGLSQQQLADVAGLTRSSVASIETGRQSVSVHHVYALARALHTAPHDLLPIMEHTHASEETAVPTRVDLFVRSVMSAPTAGGRKRK